jgi:DNA-binding MarR family transcriptional regulator
MTARRKHGRPLSATRAAQAKRRREHEPVRLENFLPFLIMRAAKRINFYFDQATHWTDLTLPDARTLGAIWRQPGVRLVELSRVTDIELSTLSRLVRRLERRKLCVIATRDRDSRIGSIRLSPKGLETVQNFATVGLGIEKLLQRDLSAREATLLKLLLRKTSVDVPGPKSAGRAQSPLTDSSIGNSVARPRRRASR